MTPPPRSARHPVRVAHLGLGAFHRAHQAWYTQAADDAGGSWGIAAFTGRSPEAARVLAAQDAVYTLVERGADGDAARPVDALSRVHDGADRDAWRATIADPDVAVLTLTVTEAGYRPGSGAPARVLDGLAARSAAGAGGIAVVSCDNLARNGEVLRDSVLALAAPDAELSDWIRAEVSFVSTMVDRITPATTDADRAEVRRLTGWDDAAPVVTEPFTEWVLAGAFPAGRPDWEAGGARFVADIEPFERRKLWLLNAGHSLLAYQGLLRGRATVAEAVGDPALRDELELLWSEQRTELPFDDAVVDEALAALRDRFANGRIEHRVAQIGADGSQKLGPRIVDPLRARLTAGRPPGTAQTGVLAAWALHLVQEAGDLRDAGAADLAPRLREARTDADRAVLVLDALAPDLTERTDLVGLIADRIASLQGAPA
ncbi:fructuronate reductase [Leifsonia sp. 98AMF]|uniref:mannitol dehydrogenase family protein n=1 Tax=unclassified Leifsonia TaxID=2663824 RepID=UPI00087C2448|nr:MULTISPECIES: mannitol dehydrogenase family protein [unclassified Leifsonia]SDH48593.1 fructuronate reductase [Leifsonia sp. 197AMF]SDI89137.1 fructuronate reductase [Leifsonia sp. 466MF]SDJ91616.1 fructuronate reductase [Leifsonia sp. 157MF]SDN92828.1 fructuronate reductase [Leifsonia sp. 509MF]SEN13032.1 fructuronate reductase [Leifsonia sp. 467MF]